MPPPSHPACRERPAGGCLPALPHGAGALRDITTLFCSSEQHPQGPGQKTKCWPSRAGSWELLTLPAEAACLAERFSAAIRSYSRHSRSVPLLLTQPPPRLPVSFCSFLKAAASQESPSLWHSTEGSALHASSPGPPRATCTGDGRKEPAVNL